MLCKHKIKVSPFGNVKNIKTSLALENQELNRNIWLNDVESVQHQPKAPYGEKSIMHTPVKLSKVTTFNNSRDKYND